MDISYNNDKLSKMKIPQHNHVEKPILDSTIDLVFENKIWPAFSDWFSKSNFKIYKQVDSFKWELIDYLNIRNAFINYDYTKSDLRKDRFVLTPTNRTEEFLEFFFLKIGAEWDNPHDEDGDEWDEQTMQDFITHMKAAT